MSHACARHWAHTSTACAAMRLDSAHHCDTAVQAGLATSATARSACHAFIMSSARTNSTSVSYVEMASTGTPAVASAPDNFASTPTIENESGPTTRTAANPRSATTPDGARSSSTMIESSPAVRVMLMSAPGSKAQSGIATQESSLQTANRPGSHSSFNSTLNPQCRSLPPPAPLAGTQPGAQGQSIRYNHPH